MEQVQLNHILLDVDFFDKPKIKALAFKYEQISVLLLIKIYTSMSRATNALVTRDTIEALAWEMRFEAEKVEPFLSYAVSENLIILEGDQYTSGRVKEDQQKLAVARKKAKDRQAKARESQECNADVTCDSSVTDVSETCDLDPVSVTVSDNVINKNKKSKQPKIQFGEYVYLTEPEIQKFKADLGDQAFERCCEKLDAWIASAPNIKRRTNGKNAAATFRSWVINAIAKEQSDAASPNGQVVPRKLQEHRAKQDLILNS